MITGGRERGSGVRVVHWRVAAAAATTAVKIVDTERESGGDRQTCRRTRWSRTWSGNRRMVQTMGGGIRLSGQKT